MSYIAFISVVFNYGTLWVYSSPFITSFPYARLHSWIPYSNLNWENIVEYSPQCITFSVSHNTTCNEMCIFCRRQLGDDAFYFTDNVCLRKGNGAMCHGTPIPSTNYTCCIY